MMLSENRYALFGAMFLMRWPRWSEDQLRHPDDEAIAADDGDGEQGPDQYGQNEKCEKLLTPGVARRRAL